MFTNQEGYRKDSPKHKIKAEIEFRVLEGGGFFTKAEGNLLCLVIISKDYVASGFSHAVHQKSKSVVQAGLVKQNFHLMANLNTFTSAVIEDSCIFRTFRKKTTYV